MAPPRTACIITGEVGSIRLHVVIMRFQEKTGNASPGETRSSKILMNFIS